MVYAVKHDLGLAMILFTTVAVTINSQHYASP